MMDGKKASIGDLVRVRAHPTVVRLEHLDTADAAWLTESFVLTPEVEAHFEVIRKLLASGQGSGLFLIGHYGSGKSHFLAYLARELAAGDFLPSPPRVQTLSLVNYSADNRLEAVVCRQLGLPLDAGDRRLAWDRHLAGQGQGEILLLDELSEFLRSKTSGPAFNEDIRFLQFLGEWAQDRPFWILAAMQEGIEHTGELEFSLYRKIKDRYPTRLLLTPAHVQTLISDSILVKSEGYENAVQRLIDAWRTALPKTGLDFNRLQAIYPLHPATLALLEEVRDRFSQARGVVDFVVKRLAGDPTRDIESFLDKPWGDLITPDLIVDHFRDLFEIQPEYLALAQQVLPWYQKHLTELFEKPALQRLAERLLKLLILVYLSPARERLTVMEAVSWLAFSATRIDPERNQRVIERVLSQLVEHGRFVARSSGGYALNLRDDGAAALESQLKRTLTELAGQDELILETLVGLLPARGFNPFQLPRDQWCHQQVDWRFHPRRYSVWFGNRTPDRPETRAALCLRLPWGEAQPAPGLYTIIPARIQVDADMRELAALVRLQERPLAPEVAKRVKGRLQSRQAGFITSLGNAWLRARLVTPEGKQEAPPPLRIEQGLQAWLDDLALWTLRRTYPGFERFAPDYGPLPKQAWLRYMQLCNEDDPMALAHDEYVRLIQEAYLLPMKLLRRQGRQYLPRANPERHELVALLTPLVNNGVSPKTLYHHLAEPIYGLVEDQVTTLLLFLLQQGEIEITKGRHSYRDYFETLPNPLQYDRITPGEALDRDTLHDLQVLCEAAGIKPPQANSALGQRRAAEQLRDHGRERVRAYEALSTRLQSSDLGVELLPRLQQQIETWRCLEQGTHALQGLELFRYQAGNVGSFLGRERQLRELADRLPRLLSEWQRFQHLVQHPHLDAPAAAELRAAITDLGEPPGLEEPEQLQAWLEALGKGYEAYKRDYRRRHDDWWRQQARREIWTWRPPALARSRHLGLDEILHAFEQCLREAQAQRCGQLANLDFQPLCNCGFDGETAPCASTLERCEGLEEQIEQQLRLYFQQPQVKARMREWRTQGLEVTPGLLEYLEGNQPLPEVPDLRMLDDHLAGLDQLADVDVDEILNLLTERNWEPTALLEALSSRLQRRAGQRLRFHRPAQSDGVPAPVALWCGRQCLRQAVPLPKGLGRQAMAHIGEGITADWVSESALSQLTGLGLDEAIVERILGWLIDGHVPLPARSDIDNPVSAVRELLQPSRSETAEQIMETCELLYRHHQRLIGLAKTPWLQRMNRLAETPLPELPAFTRRLAELDAAQWLILDCLGVALVRPLAGTIEKLFHDWMPPRLGFLLGPDDTTTAGCYDALLAAGIQHGFEKINAIDELIHEQFRPLEQLIPLARARVEIAIKPLRARLDPDRPLVIFADHGFRVSAEGTSYQHGGDSAPERLIPVWYFESYSSQATGDSNRRVADTKSD